MAHSPDRTALALSVAAAAGLGLGAYVHADLAHTYAEVTGVVSEGALFWTETVLASAAALSVLLSRRLPAYAAAFAVSASALAIMLVSRYADVGPIGPFPDLYDPVWYPEKILAAIGEGVAAAAALSGIALSAAVRRPKPAS